MDSEKLFKAYLETWPDAWIMWPDNGKEKMKCFYDDGTTKALMDDLLSYIKSEVLEAGVTNGFSCSEWCMRYFKTVRGRDLVKRAGIARHEPLLFTSATGIEPFKGLMDGFILYFLEKEVLPNIKGARK